MRDHPSKYWIKFLLSRQKHSHEVIAGMLTAIGLGGAEEDFIKELDDRMEYPDPFLPYSLRHKDSQRFLRREGIYEAWHKTRAFQRAFDILGTVELRHLVETFALSPLRSDHAVKKIKQKTGLDISILTYELYQHYFWNRSLLSGAAWGQYILERDSAHMEWLQLAVHAQGAQGAQMVLWKTGSSGRLHVESGRMFKEIRDISFMCIQQIAHRYPCSDHAKTLLDYTRTAKLSQEQLDASANATEDIVQTFNSFRMRLEEKDQVPLQQLTGGRFSEAEDTTASEDGIGEY